MEESRAQHTTAPPHDDILAQVMTKLALVAAGVIGLAAGARLWNEGAPTLHHHNMYFSMILYVMGFASLVTAVALRRQDRTWAQWFALLVFVLAAALPGANRVQYINPVHGTDAIAFNHYAAELVLEGKNPYSHSMNPAFSRFHMANRLHTLTATGQAVTTLSYPALAFEPYLPLAAAGVDNMGWLHLALGLLSILLLFFLAPKRFRPLAPVLFFLDPQVADFALGGVTDILYVPLLLTAVYFWKKNRFWSAVSWGLACAIKQHPWFLAPFMAVAIYKEAVPVGLTLAGRRLAVFFGVAAGAFLLVNLPFLFWSPGAWLLGVFTPMGKQLVLFGAGIVNLTTSAGHGIPRSFYTWLALMVLTALVGIYYLAHERLEDAMWILPSIPLWVAPRSLTSYFVYWAPALALAILWTMDQNIGAPTGDETSSPPSPKQHRTPKSLGTAATLLVVTLVAAVGLAAHHYNGKVIARVVHAHDTNKIGLIDQADVFVENHGSKPMNPRFAAVFPNRSIFFWKVQDAKRLPPGASMVYHLEAPSLEAAPRMEQPFVFRVYVQPGGPFYLTPPAGSLARDALLFNQRFSFWNDATSTPIRWHRSPMQPRSSVTRQTIGGQKSLCLAVEQNGASSWKRVFLEQEASKQTRTIGFEFWTTDVATAQKTPTVLMGIEVQFPGGEVAATVPTSDTDAVYQWRNPKLLMQFRPYRTGRWSRFIVDIDDLRTRFGYDRPTSFVVRAFVARHASNPGRTQACFASIQAFKRPAEALQILSPYRQGAEQPTR